MAFNRIWPSLILMGLTLGSMAAVAQQPVKTFLPMPPDFNDERYRSPGIAYVERLWALPDCQLQTAAGSGQLFWACVISNPHPSPHDGWMWIGEISPGGQLLHSGYLSGGDKDSQSLGKGKILALSHNILILGQGTKLLAYQLSNDTETQPLKPMWVVDVGFEIAEANIGANQQVLIWGYEKQEGQIQKVLIKVFDAKGKLINEKIEMVDTSASKIIDHQFFLTDDGQIQVIGQQNNYIRQSGEVPGLPGSRLPQDCPQIEGLGLDINDFPACSAENILEECRDLEEKCPVPAPPEKDEPYYLWIEEYRENFFSCISPDEKKEVEFEEYFELPNQAVQAGFQYKNFAYAFFIINTEKVKNSLQIYSYPTCGEFSNKFAATIFLMSLPADLIDAQIKQVKILPDETVLIAYTSVVGDGSQMQLLLSRVDLQQQQILWTKMVMPATPTNDAYLRLHEDKGKVQIAIAYDEKTKQIGVAVFNNSINPNNWDDFPRPLDDQEFFPRIYTFRSDQ
ncbi:MAG: hypothetical protein IPP67_05650 [Rhodospirillaceae bacterium]|nr:hypothetical protein [Rhodospirillaceae bacterium]